MQTTMQTGDLTFTAHAHRRKARRCKCDDPLDILLAHFDQDIYVRNGVWAWSLSDAYRHELQRRGALSPSMADRVRGLVLLIAEDSGEVVTLMRGSGRPLGRYLAN